MLYNDLTSETNKQKRCFYFKINKTLQVGAGSGVGLSYEVPVSIRGWPGIGMSYEVLVSIRGRSGVGLSYEVLVSTRGWPGIGLSYEVPVSTQRCLHLLLELNATNVHFL